MTLYNRAKQGLTQFWFAKISGLSSINASKYEFYNSKDLLPEKDLLEKSIELKRLEYSSLDKELNGFHNPTKKRRESKTVWWYDNIENQEPIEEIIISLEK